MDLARSFLGILRSHLAENRQMAFVSGPRQVGKTTACRACAEVYLNWDDQDHRALVLRGPAAVMERIDGQRPSARLPVVVFDELHRYPRWKNFLKGFFDTYEARCRIIVTGSSRLDVYRRGGDSLMGRYFLYRLHPFSVGELADPTVADEPLRDPRPLDDERWEALCRFGGFPEPFVQRSAAFSRRWSALRRQQLVREDLRDLTRLHDLGRLETLGLLLEEWSGERLVFANLARELRVDEKTVRAWVETFCSFHHGFLVRPWHRNVARALRKEPKWFVRDWAVVADPGRRAETLVANHLLKAVETWTDLGLGAFALHYIRDKQQREVDFVIVRNQKPWILVEVKAGDRPLSPALTVFQQQTGAAHAVQIGLDDAPAGVDLRRHGQPIKMAARDLLGQLP